MSWAGLELCSWTHLEFITLRAGIIAGITVPSLSLGTVNPIRLFSKLACIFAIDTSDLWLLVVVEQPLLPEAGALVL